MSAEAGVGLWQSKRRLASVALQLWWLGQQHPRSHPQGADLWYDYTRCNGQSSCTMTDVCDYSGEAAGTYRVRIYSESSPVSRTRISDTSEASFVVSN